MADFNQSKVLNTIFIGADLRGVKNLDRAIGLADAKYENTGVTEREYSIISKSLSERGIYLERDNQNLFIIK